MNGKMRELRIKKYIFIANVLFKIPQGCNTSYAII